MRSCSEIQDMLTLYIDDCLDTNEEADILEHLESCPECRQELESLREVVGMFESLSEEELIPPASFRRNLRKRLDKEEKVNKVNYIDKFTKKVDKFTKKINKSSLRRWMPLAAAALLLFVMVPVLSNGLGLIGAKSTRSETPMSALNNALRYDNDEMKMEMADSAAPEASPEMEMVKGDSGRDVNMYSMKIEEGESQSIAQEAPIERKIIKTGHLNLQVDSYKATTTQIKDMVNEMQGYIVSENTHVYDDERKLLAGSLALRIPQERFDEALDRVENMGSTRNRTVDSQDVTEEYVDVESRLKAMRLKEERLLSILEKSGSLGDILAVENELAQTRGNLEALEGRLKYLDNRTELSTINIEVRETLTPVKQIKTTGLQGVLARTQEAFIKSINSIIIGFGNLIVYLGAYLPFIFITVVLLIFLWIMVRRIKKGYFNK